MKQGHADFEVGQKVDDYILEEHLGGGQDGEVWRARNESFGRVFATKFLNSIDSQEKSDRFDREIRILKELHHPCIVNVFAKGKAYNPTKKKNVPYYVMEFLDGVPLDKFLEGASPQKARDSFFVLFDHTANALLEIHGKGMSHGDLKATNIFVLADGLVAKITDFGFGIPPGEQALRREDYPESSYRAPEGLTPRQADLFRLGKTFKDCLKLIESKMQHREVLALERFLSGLTDRAAEADLNNVIQQIRDMTLQSDFLGEIDIPELIPQESSIFIMDSIQGDIFLSPQCNAVLQLRHFQHLRALRPYHSAEYVYPALSPTRFECAVGQYAELARTFRNAVQITANIEPSEIRATLLASLLREIGQYPYSTQLSGVAPQYDPYARSAEIVDNTVSIQQLFEASEVDPSRVLQLITNCSLGNNTVAGSFLWGILSASNVDETMRVLSRTGSTFTFRLDRIPRSLVFVPGKRMAIPARRKDCIAEFESYLGARYSVLERVTMHHTVLAIDQMLKHSFCDLLSGGFSFEVLLDCDDSSFLNACMKAAKKRELHLADQMVNSIRRRGIYKRLLRWPADRALCEPLSTAEEIRISRALELELRSIVGNDSLRDCFMFYSGKEHRMEIDIDILDESGDVKSAEDYIPAIRNFADMSRSLCRQQILFGTAEAAQVVAKLDPEPLRQAVESVVLHCCKESFHATK
jgi:serine/threonine protein kinase